MLDPSALDAAGSCLRLVAGEAVVVAGLREAIRLPDDQGDVSVVVRGECGAGHLGLRPESVVSVTGLALRPQEREAARLGAYRRLPMFERIERDGVRWADGTFRAFDVILWATGFRPSIGHLAPLRLRSRAGGLRLLAPRDPHTFTTSAADPRIHFVGSGPRPRGVLRAGRRGRPPDPRGRPTRQAA